MLKLTAFSSLESSKSPRVSRRASTTESSADEIPWASATRSTSGCLVFRTGSTRYRSVPSGVSTAYQKRNPSGNHRTSMRLRYILSAARCAMKRSALAYADAGRVSRKRWPWTGIATASCSAAIATRGGRKGRIGSVLRVNLGGEPSRSGRATSRGGPQASRSERGHHPCGCRFIEARAAPSHPLSTTRVRAPPPPLLPIALPSLTLPVPR